MKENTSTTILESIITIGSDMRIVAYNNSTSLFFSEIFNRKVQKGENFLNLFSAETAIILKESLEKCQQGIFQHTQFYVSSANREIKIILLPVLGEDNIIKNFSISLQEVVSCDLQSENRKENAKTNSEVEQELEYSKQIYANLFYNNPDAVFSFDLEGNFINANMASARLAEISINELLQMHFLPLIYEEDREMVLNRFSKAVQGENQNYQIRFVSVNGNRKTLDINNFPIKYNGKIIGVYGIAKDITKQKLTEDRITEERQMLRAIIDNIPDYIFVKDRKHQSILVNKKFHTQILGQSNGEHSKGYTPLDYFEPHLGTEIIEDNERVIQTGEPVINRPDLITNVDGKQEMVLLTKVPLKNAENENIGIVGIARDITQTYLHNKNQELVFKIIKAFGDKPSFNEAMTKTLKILCNDLGFDYAEAYKLSIDNRKLIKTAFWPLDKDLSDYNLSASTYSKGQGLPGRVWKTGEVEILREDDDYELLENMILNESDYIKSAVGIPIIFQGQIVSIFCLGSIQKSKEIEVAMLGSLTLQIASAIERKRTQDQLNDFFEFSPNLIAAIGMDGFVKKINPSFKEKFGFSECEILTKPFTEFIHPEDLEKTFNVISDISFESSDLEVRCRRRDGKYIWVSWRFSQYFTEENIVFIYGTDITPLKKVHQELSETILKNKEVQKKLEESEQKYKSLFDVSPLPLWVLDRKELRFLKVNQAALDLYGYTEKEFSEMTVKNLWAPNQAERVEAVVANNVNKFFQVKVEHVKKDGGRIFVNVNSNPIVFDGVESRLSLVKDVTARIKAEERLLYSEKRFKALVQEGSDLISIVDNDFNYIYNSPASKTVFGMEPVQMDGTKFEDYIYPDDYKNIVPYLEELKTKRRIQLPSYRVKNARNKWSWIETIITNLSDDPAVGGLVMNSRDITEFIEQERELVDSLKRYDIVAKATSDVITDYDIQKDEMKVSEVAFKLFGYAQKDGKYSGEWWNSKIHPEDYEYVKSLTRKMQMEGLTNLTVEYRFRCADGTYKYILDRSYLILDENDDPERIIASMQDITERKQNLIAIENHNKRLKEIAWTQSHVVRAPLAKLMGLVDLLINYKNDLDNVNELLENVLISADELDKIIRNIAVQTEDEL